MAQLATEVQDRRGKNNTVTWKEGYVAFTKTDNDVVQLGKLQQWGTSQSSTSFTLSSMELGKVYKLHAPKIDTNSQYSISNVVVSMNGQSKIAEADHDHEQLPVSAALKPFLTPINGLEQKFDKQDVAINANVVSLTPTKNTSGSLKAVCAVYDNSRAQVNVKVFQETYDQVKQLKFNDSVLIFGQVNKDNTSINNDSTLGTITVVANTFTSYKKAGNMVFEHQEKLEADVVCTLPNLSHNEQAFIEAVRNPLDKTQWFPEIKFFITGMDGDYVTFVCQICSKLLVEEEDAWSCPEHKEQTDEEVKFQCKPLLHIKVLTSKETFHFKNVTIKYGFEQLLFGMNCQDLFNSSGDPPFSRKKFCCTMGVDRHKHVITNLEEATQN